MSKTESEEGTVFAPRFDADGLLPVVATSAKTGEVLMFAYMNAEALARTIETGEAHYWSRSRGRLWRKGEESGNTQRVVEMRTDCDQDAIWLKVEQQGKDAACHTGRKSLLLPGASRWAPRRAAVCRCASSTRSGSSILRPFTVILVPQREP